MAGNLLGMGLQVGGQLLMNHLSSRGGGGTEVNHHHHIIPIAWPQPSNRGHLGGGGFPFPDLPVRQANACLTWESDDDDDDD